MQIGFLVQFLMTDVCHAYIDISNILWHFCLP